MLSFRPKFREHESGVACSFTSCYKEKGHLQQTGVCGGRSVGGGEMGEGEGEGKGEGEGEIN